MVFYAKPFQKSAELTRLETTIHKLFTKLIYLIMTYEPLVYWPWFNNATVSPRLILMIRNMYKMAQLL